ncbi:hypothetical protein F5144DRAFT_575897 [Chaetomium tenue]|uniref:Uncharacterized protein n=1 Tax=Chaetomium tenue TaxID=1854479 RepID=A0ACB7P4C1_9PEZI|nr:hypothetical protein F5144DRAFT_575897 [Chaetomium globosum]
MVPWSWCNLFLFNLHNQPRPSTVAKDARNKPWRPLPSGRRTPMQATAVMLCMGATGGLGPWVLETVLSMFAWYKKLEDAPHPFTENLLHGLGFGCFLPGPFGAATGYSVLSGRGEAARWLAILAAAITTTVDTLSYSRLPGPRGRQGYWAQNGTHCNQGYRWWLTPALPSGLPCCVGIG